MAIDPERNFRSLQPLIIKELMRNECRVSVLIPVYDEDFETVLTPLYSLSQQVGVNKDCFEVILVVNNSKQESIKKTESFLNNQKVLELVNFLRGGLESAPFFVSDEQKEKVREIKQSGIVIYAIDKSSEQSAEEYNNVGVAKDIGGWEICRRFLSTQTGDNGIIAMTDCDCWFSENYILEIIKTYDTYKLNGLAGRMEFIADPKMLYGNLVLQALRIQHGKSAMPPAKSEFTRVIFQKSQNIQHKLILDSQNMTVKVEAWKKIGGMPNFASSENQYFAKLLINLPGELALNTAYTVYTLARPSYRAGLTAFGRRVAMAAEAVKKFKEGKSSGIFIIDSKKVHAFFGRFIKECLNKDYTSLRARQSSEEFGFMSNNISLEIWSELIKEYRKEAALPELSRSFYGFEKIVLSEIYPYYPLVDISKNIIEP